MFIIYSLPGAFLFSTPQKRITLNIFHSANFLPIKSKGCLRNSLTVLLLNTTGGSLPHFSTSAAVCLIQYGIVGPWRQMPVHQHAEAASPHLGMDILQAYNSVAAKALRLISAAPYPHTAFSPVSPLHLLLYGLDVTKPVCAASFSPHTIC